MLIPRSVPAQCVVLVQCTFFELLVYYSILHRSTSAHYIVSLYCWTHSSSVWWMYSVPHPPTSPENLHLYCLPKKKNRQEVFELSPQQTNIHSANGLNKIEILSWVYDLGSDKHDFVIFVTVTVDCTFSKLNIRTVVKIKSIVAIDL